MRQFQFHRSPGLADLFGLTGPDYVSPSGGAHSEITHLSDAGPVAGYSQRVNTGYTPWVFDPATNTTTVGTTCPTIEPTASSTTNVTGAKAACAEHAQTCCSRPIHSIDPTTIRSVLRPALCPSKASEALRGS